MDVSVRKVGLLAAILAALAFGQPPDPMVAELQAFQPLPKVTPTWPWEKRITKNPELTAEMTRVLRCASLSLRWLPIDYLREVVALNPETIALHWSPYHFKFLNHPKWTKAEACGPITTKDIEYWTYFWSRCMDARTIIPQSIPVMIIFDHERGCGDDVAVGDKLNIMFRLAKQTFNGEVFWYNHNQWIQGPGTQGHVPRKASAVPSNVHGDYANLSMYRNINSVYVRRTLEFTAAANEQDLVAWVSIGGEYELWPFTPVGQNRRSPNVTGDQQLGEAWWAGFWLYDPFPASAPDSFGPVNRVKYVVLWPPPLRPGIGTDEHFLDFLRGAHEIRRPAP
jgi:hypothetical protein